MPEVYKRLCLCYVSERVATINTTIIDPITKETTKMESQEYVARLLGALYDEERSDEYYYC